jgi:hypothetical protein
VKLWQIAVLVAGGVAGLAGLVIAFAALLTVEPGTLSTVTLPVTVEIPTSETGTPVNTPTLTPSPTEEATPSPTQETPTPTATGGTPTATVTVTPTPTKDASADTDQDGCTNGQEQGPNEFQGGERNYQNFWDFFDTPIQVSGGVWQRNRVIDVDDIFAVAARFATSGAPGDPLADPPKTDYHSAFDRTFLGPDPWDLGPADGYITIDELAWLMAQFTHSCN